MTAPNTTTDDDDRTVITGRAEDNNCHICGRDMENFKPRTAEVVEDNGPQNKLVSLEKGIGTCPEHGVSYSELSMRPAERGGCRCEKEDCPTCSS